MIKTAFTLLILCVLNISCTNSNNNDVKFLKNLFGKNEKSEPVTTPKADSLRLEKTAEMLDENLFWKIVDSSVKNSSNQNEQEKYLVSEISKLSPKQIVGFRSRTDKLLYDTYTSEMWCAAYIMNGGCSDDCFEYFRNWVISRGRDVYYIAKENPDTLIFQKDHGDEGMFEFELFWYVALKAFKNTTGKELYDYIDENNFRTKEGNYPQFEFNWQERNPESRKKLCPNLYAEFENR